MAQLAIQQQWDRNEIFGKKIRENAEKAIKRIEDFTKSLEYGSTDQVSLEIRLDLLDDNFKKFVQYNDFLTCLNSDFDKEEKLERIYIEVKAKLKRRMEFLCEVDKYKPDYDNKIDNIESNELPHISLPTFSGNPAEYKTFKEKFIALGSEHNNLTEKQKEHYLKSHLTGAALDLVKEIPADNLSEILEHLDRSYNRYTPKKHEDEMTEKPGHKAYLNIQNITQELYKSIVDGAYAHAVEVSKNIFDSHHGVIISDVVNRLAQENNLNLISYIYSLWIGDGKNIVTEQMPSTFKSIFGQENVILQQKKFGLAVKLDVNKDKDGDRKAWGDSADKSSMRVVWKLYPLWQNNKVSFLLKNPDCNMFLKLEVMKDSIGDRGAFGADDNSEMRHTWFLEPVIIDGEILFYVFNRQFNQALKLAMSKDSYNDRLLWGHNGNTHKDPKHFAWYIKAV